MLRHFGSGFILRQCRDAKNILPYDGMKLLKPIRDGRVGSRIAEAGASSNVQLQRNQRFDGIVRCEVLELAAPDRLVISWRGGMLDTTVTFDLEDAEGGTRITLKHQGFGGLSNIIPSIVLGFGWKKLLASKLPMQLATARSR